MTEAFETIELNGRTAKLYPDEDPTHPKEWLSGDAGEPIIYYTSDRYTLGHEHVGKEELTELVRDKANFVAKVYAYVHGGATISLGAFSCPWDSGCSGFVVVNKKAYATMIGHRRWNGATAKRARADFKNTVETFDKYLTGDVWGYVIEDEDGEHLDSCWGFYGLDYAREEAKSALEAVGPPPPTPEVFEAGLGAHVA